MQETNSNLAPLVRRVLTLAAREGLTQEDLGRLTRISQGHLSKILKGKRELGPKAKRQLTVFVRDRWGVAGEAIGEGLGREVALAVARSPEFADLIEALLNMQNRHNPT